MVQMDREENKLNCVDLLTTVTHVYTVENLTGRAKPCHTIAGRHVVAIVA